MQSTSYGCVLIMRILEITSSSSSSLQQKIFLKQVSHASQDEELLERPPSFQIIPTVSGSISKQNVVIICSLWKRCACVCVCEEEREPDRERERELCAHWWVWGGFGKLLVTVGSMAHIWQQFIFIGCLQMNLWWPVQTSIFTRDSLIADYLRVVRNISRATGLTWTCADLGFWYLDIQKKVFHRLFYSIVYYYSIL